MKKTGIKLPPAVNAANHSPAFDLLAGRLRSYSESDAIVTSTYTSSQEIARSLAFELKLRFEPVIYEKIAHPSQRHRHVSLIGEQSAVRRIDASIPQALLARRIACYQYEVLRNKTGMKHPFSDNTVILAADPDADSESVIESLGSIRSKAPCWLIAIVPAYDSDTQREIESCADEVLVFGNVAGNSERLLQSEKRMAAVPVYA